MNYHIGIDLGGTNIAVGIVDDACQILARGNRKTNPALGFEGLVKEIADTAWQAVADAGFDRHCITSVGMGTPSCVNPRTGRLVNANNLGWINVPLQDEIQQYFSQEVKIANDADCAALGEATVGAAAGCDNAIMVTLGTGVGGGIILDGKIYSGADKMGSEIGHTKLVFNGEKCSCGQRGCLEAYASATALIRQARRAMAGDSGGMLYRLTGGNPLALEAKTVFDAAQAMDRTAQELLDQYISYLAAGISTLVALYRPQVVVVGGGISRQGDYLIRPLREKLYGMTFAAKEIGIPEILAAKLGNNAGIVGAARLGYL